MTILERLDALTMELHRRVTARVNELTARGEPVDMPRLINEAICAMEMEQEERHAAEMAALQLKLVTIKEERRQLENAQRKLRHDNETQFEIPLILVLVGVLFLVLFLLTRLGELFQP